MVTAEIAVALPSLLVVLGGALTAVAVAGAQVRCIDAARETARIAARGDDAAVRYGSAVAPDGARVSLSRSGDSDRVTVSATVHPVGRVLPGFTVGAHAVALHEPGSP